MDEDWVSPAIRNLMDLWVKPEIERRLKDGRLQLPFILDAAQVVMYSDSRPPEIRLNNEIRAQAYVKLKDGVSKQKGDQVNQDEIEYVHQLQLPPDADPDCGHATIVRMGNGWGLSFDFVYNKGLSFQHIRSAEDFFATAVDARSQGRIAPFLDNLFSAAELAARSILLSAPDPDFAKKGSHGSIHSRINQEGKLGNLDAGLVQAFNSLQAKRTDARYRAESFALDESTAAELQKSVRDLIDLAKRRIDRSPPK
jgi:hypothetical protein